VSFDQINGDGFRFYRYDPEDGSEPTDLLSVTSIRTLCGESFNLVNWQMANLADAALGTQKRQTIGPRGGVKETRQVWEFPSEFARMYEASNGEQGKIDALRKWLRARADEPRNIAAVRGTLTHEAIEKGVDWRRVERAYVENAVMDLRPADQKKLADGVTDEDVLFVRNALRQYADMRKQVPFVILGREVRIANLTAGYAGTFDALVWLLPDGFVCPLRGEVIDAAYIAMMGGKLALLDWKTSTGVYTDQVVQAHAYLSAEVAFDENGKPDSRLTDLLTAAHYGGLAHIRPNGWALHLFAFEEEVVRAFLGSVAFARLLAKYPEPTNIFSETIKGESQEPEE
jgi:hypothetical protein